MDWIKLKDRLPPEGETVILSAKDLGVQVGELEVDRKGGPLICVFPRSSCDDYGLGRFSHWMPLPKGPHEKE